jgi:ABC-type nitrate/sulfonate/bicarbonate transport system permease component
MAVPAIGSRTRAQVAPEPALRIPGRPSRLARYEPALIGGIAVAVFIASWQLVASRRLVSQLFLPGPLDIGSAFGEYIAKGTIWNDMWVSGQELVLGFGLAILVGLPLGLLIGWYRRLSYAIDPFVMFFNSIPRVALTPLFIIWFGIGINSKVAIVFLGAVFAILINTAAASRNLDTSLVRAARSFGASDTQLFRTVILPGSVPFVLSGLRLGLAHALTGVVVAELVAAQAGVGLMMATAGQTFQTPKVFVGLVIVAGAGLIMTLVLGRIERRFQSWRAQPRS